MTFANEVKDFLAGYTAMREVGLKKKGLELDEKKVDSDIKYQDAVIDLRRQELDLDREKFAKANERASAAAARAAAATTEKARGSSAEAAIADTDEDTVESFNYGNDTGYFAPGLGENLLPPAPVEEFAEGGMVGAGDSYRQELERALANPNLDEAYRETLQRKLEEHTNAGRKVNSRAPAAIEAPRMANTMQNGEDVSPQVQNLDAMMPQDTPPRAALPGTMPPPSAETDAPPPEQPGNLPPTPRRRPNPTTIRLVEKRSADAMQAAADFLEAEIKTPKAAVGPGSEKSGIDFATGEGANTFEENEAMRQAVDPNNTLEPHLKSMVTLSEAYTYFLERGETDKAARAAAKFLTAERQTTQVLGTLAMEAMKSGNVEEAARLMGDAIDRFPMGHQIVIEPDKNGVLTYSVLDANGVIEQGKLNVNQFMEQALGIANGSAYTQAMLTFVEANKKGTGDKKKPDAAISEAVDAASQLDYYRDQLESLELSEDVSPEELAAAREDLKAASARVSETRNAALELGIKRTDLDAEIKARATPYSPPDAGAIPTEEENKPGLIGRALDFAGRGLMPETYTGAPRVGDDGGTGGDGTSQGNTKAPAGAPRVGEVIDGWRFKGGNPADQKNWEKVSQ